MHIYAKHTIYGKEMPYIYHIWYNCTAVHSQKLPIIYERGLVLQTERFDKTFMSLLADCQLSLYVTAPLPKAYSGMYSTIAVPGLFMVRLFMLFSLSDQVHTNETKNPEFLVHHALNTVRHSMFIVQGYLGPK